MRTSGGRDQSSDQILHCGRGPIVPFSFALVPGSPRFDSVRPLWLFPIPLSGFLCLLPFARLCFLALSFSRPLCVLAVALCRLPCLLPDTLCRLPSSVSRH